MSRDHSRQNEGSLLALTLLILWSGSTLLFLARTRDGIPKGAVNVNTATASQFQAVFGIDGNLARKLVAARNGAGGFRYASQVNEALLFDGPTARALIEKTGAARIDLNEASVRQIEQDLGISRAEAARIAEYRDSADGRFDGAPVLSRIPLMSADSYGRVGDRLIARGPRDVVLRFATTILGLSLLFVVIPVILRRRGLRPDPLLLPLVFALVTLGFFAQTTLRDPFRDALTYSHHAGGLFVGLVGLAAAAMMPAMARASLRRYTYVWGLAAFFLTILLLLFGTGPGGVRLSLWFFQPIEVVKLLLILFLAGYLAERAGLLSDSVHRWKAPLRGVPEIAVPRREDFAPMAVMVFAALVLFAAVKDLGPALIVFGTFLTVFYIATGRSGVVWAGVGLIAAGALLAHTMKVGVIPVRIGMWQSPWDNPYPNGMQLGQSYWALASGGLWGAGLGLGLPGLLPRGRDDLVFSVLGEELGLVGSVMVLILYCLLAARGFRTARSAVNDFDRMLASGISALMACQAFVVLAGVTGLLPLSGITLPFLAYGNSALVVNLLAAGLLAGISGARRMTESPDAPLLQRRTLRQAATVACVGLLGLVGIGRVAALQLLRDDETAGRTVRTPDSDGIRRAKTNPRLLAMERRIQRGSIYDRNGRVLATSRPREISLAVKDERRASVPSRIYPYGEALAHLVGYVDPAVGGPVGMEREYNSRLRGFARHIELVQDYRNKDLPRWLTFRRERVAQNLHLTVDADLQQKTFDVLRKRAAALRDRKTGRPKNKASMVMLDPSTGEVLIAVSIPSFNPNTLTRKTWRAMTEDRRNEARLFDRARQGAYPPGSSLKVATAAAAMEAGLDPVFTCAHVADRLRWRYGGKIYTRNRLSDDQGDAPHGQVAMPEGLRHSCNLYFARLGIELGTSRLRKAFEEQFGLRYTKAGAAFAKDLPLNAIGQGTMLASPMEMARVAASVANRGRMMRPRFIKEAREQGEQLVYSGAPAVIARPMGEMNARRLAEMMRSVVTGGTARGVFDGLPVEVAGKTGTAETDEGDGLPHSWFIGFTPFSQPKFAFACVIENGGYGKRGAAPAVNDVLAEVFER